MKKVIYIEIDEEITSIYERVKMLPQEELYLVIPRKALLFQSGVNLKILKTKLQELGKKLVLVTSDSIGKNLAEPLGIEVAPRVEVEKMEAMVEETAQMKIQPIQARRNEVKKDQPRRFTEKKMTIAELVREFRLKREKGKTDRNKTDLSLPWHPNRKFLSLILLVSVGLFILIGYLALPGVTIAIRPSFEPITHTVNLTLADKRKNQNLLLQNQPHVIPSEMVETVTKQTKVFNTTSQEFFGTNAKGFVTFLNLSEEPWGLVGGTRLQTEEGIVFRTKNSLIVPPAVLNAEKKEIPGKLPSVPVEADPFDRTGKPVGARGNIGPARFFLPALSKINQSRIWAESAVPMTGGVTQYRKKVMTQDIEAAKKQIKDNLAVMAEEELENFLDTKNKLNHTHLVLLEDPRYLKTELQDLRLSEDLEGSPREKFEVFAKIKAEGVAYDFDQLLNVLQEELKGRAHPDRQIRPDSIHPDNIHYEVIDEDPLSGRIKITATLKGIEEFIVDPAAEAGKRLEEKIKAKVLGMKIKEAEQLLNNLPEIDAVEIIPWPFWISTMPRIPDNVKIKPMDSE